MSWRYLEQAVVAASALLVAALVGTLTWLDLRSGALGPRVEARILSTSPVTTFEVRNAGDQPVTPEKRSSLEAVANNKSLAA